jgi:oxepin-CoA hydrolase/3-oxo-5,6-dehydrosuberyl-CoA semialdehyde dehydrogenase
MNTLRSYLNNEWVAGSGPAVPLVDPTTGIPFATVSSAGLDLRAALAYARERGGPGLRALTFAERGGILERMAAAIHAHRDDLIELSRTSAGTTRSDGKFDVDGASGTLAYYAGLGKQMGAQRQWLDGEPEPIGRSKRFVGQHLWVPRHGVAIHLNAFNFPAWGMVEKAAVALLAGMPVFTKPATSTCPVAVRIVELWVESGALPPGALSLLVGPARDLVDHVGPQDVVAFTGGTDTARALRGHPAIVANHVRLNIEADSLNASVLGPDAVLGSDTFQMFVNDVARDVLQKAGQKCTAVRRIFVPAQLADEAVAALVDRLSRAVVGNPADKATDVGPLASEAQQRAATDGLAALGQHARVVWRAEAPGHGCFVTPTLFRSDDGVDTPVVHDHEVFGPVATVLPWAGDAATLVTLVARGGGGLVASLYTDDPAFAADVIPGIAAHTGRIHWGSAKVHDQSPGPGTVLPHLVHGGPGKAGGGEELGGARGLQFYWQRCAIQGDQALLARLLGGRVPAP